MPKFRIFRGTIKKFQALRLSATLSFLTYIWHWSGSTGSNLRFSVKLSVLSKKPSQSGAVGLASANNSISNLIEYYYRLWYFLIWLPIHLSQLWTLYSSLCINQLFQQWQVLVNCFERQSIINHLKIQMLNPSSTGWFCYICITSFSGKKQVVWGIHRKMMAKRSKTTEYYVT